MRLNERWQFWISVCAAALLALILYAPTLRLPLMFDDLLHIRLASEVDFWSVWLPSSRFGFYRPFVFVPMLLIERIFGGYPSTLLHALNIFQHAFNCFLLAWLAWRLWGDWTRSVVAGLLLATYPFTYQAVALYGNNIYPTSSSILLLLLHLYLTISNDNYNNLTQRRRLFVGLVLLFVYGLLSHETVVLFGPIAVLLQFSREDGPLDWRRYQTALLFCVLGGLYIVAYQFFPIAGGPTDDLGTTALLPKLLYLLQTAVYPVAWFARLTDAVSEALVWFGAGLVGVWSAWTARRGQGRNLLFGWGWWLLAGLVIGVNLPTYYILHGARLVYLSGVAAALIWAILLGEMWERGNFGRILATLILLFTTSIGWQFVRDRLDAFSEIATPVNTVEQFIPDRPASEGVLLVNLPAWTAPAETTFPIGVEYVTLMGFHLFAEELIVENTFERPVLAVDAPDLLGSPSYAYGIHDQAQLDVISADWSPAGSHVFITRYPEEGIETAYVGMFAPPKADATPIATLGGYTLASASARSCRGAAHVSLAWAIANSAELPPTVSLFVQLLDANGALIAQSDGPPLGLAPTSYALPANWRIVDERLLTPENGVGATVLVGSYDFMTGERFPAFDSAGGALPDNALRLSAEACN